MSVNNRAMIIANARHNQISRDISPAKNTKDIDGIEIIPNSMSQSMRLK